MKTERARRPRRPLILAIDQGTTQSKAFLFDPALRMAGEGTREVPQHFPRPGWVEHDLEEIHESVRGAVLEAIRRSGSEPSSIAAIGITNQRETTAIWRKDSGKPIHRAIVWQDRRTAEDCLALERKGLEEKFAEATGLVLDPYFSGTKIAWILRRVAGARRDAERGRLLFGTIDSYLAWRLTGGREHVTDPTNASRTLLMDIRSLEWSDELLAILRVPRPMLAEIRSNDASFGVTSGAGFLPDGIPIASIIGDQQSALFGQGAFSKGDAKCTYGTGAFLVLNTGATLVRSRNGLLTTVAWELGKKACYALEGSTFIAGAIVQWLRDGLGIIRGSGDVEALARSVPDSGGVVLVPALAGLGAPHWEPGVRGLIAGITRGTTAAHIARAALEGIALQIHDLARAMEEDLGHGVRALRVDGGAARNDLLVQLEADLLRTEILRPSMASSTALGTALLAGLSTGLVSSRDAVHRALGKVDRFRPRATPAERRALLGRWADALARARLQPRG
jgi:glycerol kinase